MNQGDTLLCWLRPWLELLELHDQYVSATHVLQYFANEILAPVLLIFDIV